MVVKPRPKSGRSCTRTSLGRIGIVATLILGAPALLQASVYYVDQHHISANDSNPGTIDLPWKTITKANQTLFDGDTVIIRSGVYSTYIAPIRSGTPTQPITYRNHERETVTISDAAYGINLDGKSYVIIQGVNFYNLDKFIWLQNGANYNTIAYCNFDQGRNVGWSGSKIYRNSKYNWVHHCRFSKYGYYTNDDIGCILDIGNEESTTDTTSHNLIEYNLMFHGGHHVLGVYGMYNVIRYNYFHNEPWSMGTPESDRGAILYGDRNLSFSGYPNNSGRNLFEGNRVAYSSDPPDNIGASGMALNTAYNIVRRNTYVHNDRAGISMSLTSTYYSDIVYNKVYNNSLFHNGINTQDPIDHMNSGIGFGIYSGTHIIKYNSLINNILYKHRAPFGSYKVNLSDQFFSGNWDGDTQGDPRLFSASTTLGDPFNASLPDLRLQSDSPCIDAGTHLTTITSPSATGATFIVADAGFFMDGWGIPGVTGDLIQLFGAAQRARIVSVNYATNTIVVDRPLAFTQNQGIALAYEGTAPDVGAYEHIPPPATGFYSVTPCRVLDTRNSIGPDAAFPVLEANTTRIFTVTGKCGVPSEAQAVSVNITVVGATAIGDLRVVAGHLMYSDTSSLSVPINRARANSAIVQLASDQTGKISVINDASGSMHFILDVNGYFR